MLNDMNFFDNHVIHVEGTQYTKGAVKFWGRVSGVENDYLVAQVGTEDVFTKQTFYRFFPRLYITFSHIFVGLLAL